MHELESPFTESPRQGLWMILKKIVLGLPALVVAAGAVCVVLFGNEMPKTKLVSNYHDAAEKAIENDRFDEADLYLRKVVSLEPFNMEFQYELALNAERMENHTRAGALMSRLAPEDKRGYGPAHLWQATRLYEIGKRPGPPENLSARLEHHLQASIRPLGEHDQAHMMLGQLYLAQAIRESDANLLEKSRQHLSQGVPSYPESRMSVAELHRRLGDAEKAEREAKASLQHYQAKLEADPHDLDARLRVAVAQSFLLRFGSAIETLRDGLPLTDDPKLRKALANAYLSGAKAVGMKRPEAVAKQLELLQEALKLDPENELVLTNFAAITARSDPAADAARETLQEILAQGRAPATVHLILGSIAMQRGQDDKATYHLNQALELNPRMPEVLNNLAWHLAFSEPPQLERALDLADRAVEIRPENIEFRDTRGQILLKLGRHQDALKELLIAVRHFPNRAQTHQSLAEVYDQLGDSEMSELHRQQADSARP